MSASRERKKRQESQAGGAVSKKAARAAERKAAERRSNILYASIAVLFVIVAVLLVVYNSGIFQRGETAVTVGEDTYTAADLSYYYYQALNEVYAASYGYPSMVGLDLNASFKDQAAWGSTEEDAQTWDEYFKEQAVEMMRYVTAAKAAAEEEGFTLSEDDEAAIADAIEAMKCSASSNGMLLRLLSEERLRQPDDRGLLREERPRQRAGLRLRHRLLRQPDLHRGCRWRPSTRRTPPPTRRCEYMLVTVDGGAESTEDEEGNTVEPTEEESCRRPGAAPRTPPS